jgi:L-iditol 2-dehydrogenase
VKAAIVQAPGRIECAEVPIPELPGGHVMVRTTCQAICGSDLHEVYLPLARDRFPCRPGFPGHEGVGEVVESRLTVPDRAASAGFAEYQALPERFLIAVSPAIEPEILMLAQPLGTAIYALAVCHPGVVTESALVLGQGLIGLCFTKLLKRGGVQRVITVELEPNRRALSGVFGADRVVDPTKESVVDVVRDMTHGEGVPLVIEAAGTDVTRVQAIHCVAVDGYICLFGLPENDEMSGFPLSHLYRTRARMRSIFNAQHESGLKSFREAIRLIEEDQVDVGRTLTHRFPLDAIDTAFALAFRRGEGAIKIGITL